MKFDVHVYPVYRAKLRIEADDPERGYAKAEATILETFVQFGHRHSTGDLELEFAEKIDGGLVNVLDVDGNQLTEFVIGKDGKIDPIRSLAKQHAGTLDDLLTEDGGRGRGDELDDALSPIIQFLGSIS